MMYKPVEKSSGVGCAKPQRQAQILTCLYDQRFPEIGAAQANAGSRQGWLSTGQLARACGMSASPHFRKLLLDLIEWGAVVGESEQYRSNMSIYYWKIADETRWSKEWRGVFDAYLGGIGDDAANGDAINSEAYTRIINENMERLAEEAR